MGIRLNVNGETVNGYITISYKTKHDSLSNQLVTNHQKVRFNETPIASVEADIGSSVAIRLQARIRKLPVETGRALALKGEIDYNESRSKLVQVRPMTLDEMKAYFATLSPETRALQMKELAGDDVVETTDTDE